MSKFLFIDEVIQKVHLRCTNPLNFICYPLYKELYEN